LAILVRSLNTLTDLFLSSGPFCLKDWKEEVHNKNYQSIKRRKHLQLYIPGSGLGQDETDGMCSVRQSYESRNFSAKTTGIIMASWRTGTIFHLQMDLLLP
jgi:hypothetical protein